MPAMDATPEGPIFLYLHGFASSPGSTKARAFTQWGQERGLTIQALDLRVPSFEGLRLSAIVARVRAAIDAAGGPKTRAVLIGSSLGGLAACRAAESDPRVASVFLMAPAFKLAERWRARLGEAAWEAWRRGGYQDVEDHATGAKARVEFGFVEELARMEKAAPWPDVRVPACIVHGVNDDIVDVNLSREWANARRHVRLVEVDDGHELSSSIPKVLEEAEAFLRPFGA